MQPCKPDDEPDDKDTEMIKSVLDILQMNSRRFVSIPRETALKWRFITAEKMNARTAELNRKKVWSLNAIDLVLRRNIRIHKKKAIDKWFTGHKWLVMKVIEKMCLM